MISGVQASAAEAVYRCGAAARWLPRILAGSVLCAGLLVAMRFDPHSVVPGMKTFRAVLVVGSAMLALWVVRRGGEVRLEIGVGEKGLDFSSGSRQYRLRYSEIASLRYDSPFAASRHWLPAATLVDRQGRAWRLPALLEGGERLIGQLLDRTGREDLRSWADALRVRRRMGRPSRRVALGYAVATTIFLAGVLYHVH